MSHVAPPLSKLSAAFTISDREIWSRPFSARKPVMRFEVRRATIDGCRDDSAGARAHETV